MRTVIIIVSTIAGLALLKEAATFLVTDAGSIEQRKMRKTLEGAR